MKKVKISHPRSWVKDGHWDFLHHTNKGYWGDYLFEINGDGDKFDAWIVYGDLDDLETTNCLQGRTIYVSSEVQAQVPNYPDKFLNQFNFIVSNRADLSNYNTIENHYICPWQVKKSYDQLYSIISFSKEQDLSAIVSTSVLNQGHRDRLEFIVKLKSYFGKRLDWFSKGQNYIEDKWDGLYNYRYSIAIENCSYPGYFTEKITDVYLSGCMPIYWGCPDIENFFPPDSMIRIDLSNFDKTVEVIENAIQGNLFEKNFEQVLVARDLVLNKYQPIPTFVRIIEQMPLTTSIYSSITLSPIRKFESKGFFSKIFQTLK